MVSTDFRSLASNDAQVNRQFLTTQWQLVTAAGNDSTDAREHLDQLLRLYLPALQSFLANRYRLPIETVQDVLQEFVAAKILSGSLVSSADPARGRFRTLLLTSLTRHTTSYLRRLNAAKRIPEHSKVPLDLLTEQTLSQDPVQLQPSFDPALNRAIIDEALKRFRKHCDRRRKLVMWEVFEGRIVKPFLAELPEEPYDKLVKRLQLDSHQKATNLLMSGKRSFIKILETVVTEFALNINDAETELALLRHYCGFDNSDQEPKHE